MSSSDAFFWGFITCKVIGYQYFVLGDDWRHESGICVDFGVSKHITSTHLLTAQNSYGAKYNFGIYNSRYSAQNHLFHTQPVKQLEA